MINAQEVWNSLYTTEVETIWKTERQELRKSAMIYYVLQQEFQKLQDNLSNQMKQFEHQILSIQELKSKEKCDSVEMPLSENELSKSPKINKSRNYSFNRRIPDLKLNLSKENIKLKKGDFDLNDIVESSPELSFNNTKQKETKRYFTPIKASDVSDVVDSSLIIENTPVNSFVRKTNKKIVKKISKKDKSSTLTQLFKNLPSSKSIGNNDTKLFNQNPSTSKRIESKLIDLSADETFFDVKMETSNVLKKEPKNTFKDYDKFPITKPKSPLFVHKTEPVRRKADRMQLPGWSCDDCRKFYESSDLPPEVLREKMNACSRHRNKFEPADETFEGYWDVEMFPTQDENM